ncbi:putative Guanine exchange factor for Rac 30 [Blattamonas nauphoetae]|uniref:Guanine exchange factor for Rac 30 n=1 Tax=Blattamonas nauphoetae TaxID=2049346 RepID=A0ABQ9YKS8_9EUKA|nr:putative Guanine exchange factor for Rac 30 [Blattamonas nauphoetae]
MQSPAKTPKTKTPLRRRGLLTPSKPFIGEEKASIAWKSRLTSLSQNRSLISTISESAQESKLSQVRAIDGRIELNNCSLKTLSGLDENQLIEYLYLRCNYLSFIPFSLQLDSLRILDVSSNQITSLTFLSRLPSLKQLYCNFNNINKLPALEAPHPSLEFLSLSHNVIESFRGLHCYPQLRTLIISHNNIDTFDSLVEQHETSLKAIRIDNNPICDSDHCNDFTRTVLLVCFPHLSRIDGTTVTDEDRQSAAKYPHKLATCVRLGMPINGKVAQSEDPESFNTICDIYLKELQISSVEEKGFKLTEIEMIGQRIEGETLEGSCVIGFDDGSYEHQTEDGAPGDDVRMSSESFDIRAAAASALSKQCSLKYRWLREQNDGTFAPIEGEENQEYLLTKDDVGRCVRFEVMAAFEEHAVIVFALSNNILAANPKCLSIAIEGDCVEDSTVKVVPTCVGVDASRGSFKFERVLADISKYPPVITEPEQVEFIRESNSDELRLTTDDVGCFIRITHVPANVVNMKGEPFTFLSALVIPVLPRVSNVRIQGDLVEGAFLEGAGDYGGGEEGTSEYSWATRKPGEDEWIDVEEEKRAIELAELEKRRELENKSRSSVKSTDPLLTPQTTARDDDAMTGKTIMQTISTMFVPSAIHCNREVRFGYTPISQFGVRGQTVYGYSDGVIKAGPPSVAEIELIGNHIEGEKVYAHWKYSGGMEGESEVVWVRLHEDPAVVCAPPKPTRSPSPQLPGSNTVPLLSPKDDGKHGAGQTGSQASTASSKSTKKSTSTQPKTAGKSQAAPRVSTGKSVVQFAPINPKAKGSGQSQSKVFRGTRPTQSIVSHMRNNIYQPKDEEKKTKKLEDIEFTIVGRGKEYVCVKEDIGKVLAVKVRAVRADGVRCPTETMQASKEKVKPTVPKFTSIKVVGTRQEGEDLTVETTYVGGNEGRSEFSWFVEEKDQEKIEKMKKQSQKAKRSAQTSPQRQPGQMPHSFTASGMSSMGRFGSGMQMRTGSYAQPIPSGPGVQRGRSPIQTHQTVLSPQGTPKVSPTVSPRGSSPIQSSGRIQSPTHDKEAADPAEEKDGTETEQETSSWAPLELCENKLFSPTLICVGKRVKVVGVPIREDNVRGEPIEFILDDLIIPALPKAYQLTLKLNEKEDEPQPEKKSRQSDESLRLKRNAFVLPTSLCQSLLPDTAPSPQPTPFTTQKPPQADNDPVDSDGHVDTNEVRREGEIRVGDSLKVVYRYFGGVEGSTLMRWKRSTGGVSSSLEPVSDGSESPSKPEKRKTESTIVGFGMEYKVQEEDICCSLSSVVIAERNDGVKAEIACEEPWREKVHFDGIIPTDLRVVLVDPQEEATHVEGQSGIIESKKEEEKSITDDHEKKDDEAEEAPQNTADDRSDSASVHSKASESTASTDGDGSPTDGLSPKEELEDETKDETRTQNQEEATKDESATTEVPEDNTDAIHESSNEGSKSLHVKSGDVLRVEYSHDADRFRSNPALVRILTRYADSLKPTFKEESDVVEEAEAESDPIAEVKVEEVGIQKEDEDNQKDETGSKTQSESPPEALETASIHSTAETASAQQPSEEEKEAAEEPPKDSSSVHSHPKDQTEDIDLFVRIDWIGVDSTDNEHLLATNARTLVVTNEMEGMQILCRVVGLTVSFGLSETAQNVSEEERIDDAFVLENPKAIWESALTEPAEYVMSEEERRRKEEEQLRQEEEERRRKEEEEEKARQEEANRLRLEEEERLRKEEEEKERERILKEEEEKRREEEERLREAERIAKEQAEEEEKKRKEEEERIAKEKAEEEDRLKQEEGTEIPKEESLEPAKDEEQVEEPAQEQAQDKVEETDVQPVSNESLAQPSTDTEPAADNKRQHVLNEILSTERTYVSQLDVFVRIFFDECKAKKEQLGLTDADIKAIFSQIVAILKTNQELLKQLEDSIEEHHGEGVGTVIDGMSAYLRCYKPYLKNFTNSQNTLADLQKKNKAFRKFLQQCSQHPDANSFPIESFLILPVQRLPRYKMLLEQLLKYTEETHPEYPKIKSALENITALAEDANQQCAENEEKMGVVVFLNELTMGLKEMAGPKGTAPRIDGSAIVTPSRRLLNRIEITSFETMEGDPEMKGVERMKEMLDLHGSTDKKKRMEMLLFNDSIAIITRDKKFKRKRMNQKATDGSLESNPIQLKGLYPLYFAPSFHFSNPVDQTSLPLHNRHTSSLSRDAVSEAEYVSTLFSSRLRYDPLYDPANPSLDSDPPLKTTGFRHPIKDYTKADVKELTRQRLDVVTFSSKDTISEFQQNYSKAVSDLKILWGSEVSEAIEEDEADDEVLEPFPEVENDDEEDEVKQEEEEKKEDEAKQEEEEKKEDETKQEEEGEKKEDETKQEEEGEKKEDETKQEEEGEKKEDETKQEEEGEKKEDETKQEEEGEKKEDETKQEEEGEKKEDETKQEEEGEKKEDETKQEEEGEKKEDETKQEEEGEKKEDETKQEEEGEKKEDREEEKEGDEAKVNTEEKKESEDLKEGMDAKDDDHTEEDVTKHDTSTSEIERKEEEPRKEDEDNQEDTVETTEEKKEDEKSQDANGNVPTDNESVQESAPESQQDDS